MANLALNGCSIDTLEEVASNFIDSEILDAYRSGLLREWLIDQGLDEEEARIGNLEDSDDVAILDGIIAALNLDMEMVKMARESLLAAAKQGKEAKEELCEPASVEIAERTIEAQSAESSSDLNSACVIDHEDEGHALEVVKRFLADKWVCRGLPPEVFRLLKKAASCYNVEALVLLGRFYENRWNIGKAIRCYHWAALRGFVEGEENIARCRENGIGLSLEEVESRKQFAKQFKDSLTTRGLKYLFGTDSVEVDNNKAFELFSKSAEKGDSEAGYWLGFCYENGCGVVKDEQMAFKAYKRSAAKGYGDAQNAVGIAYCFGRGVEKDDEIALKWFKKSADNGCAVGQLNLAYCFRNGDGCEQDEAAAMDMFRAAAENGNAKAQYELAQALRLGENCEQDQESAIEWYSKAAEQDNADALCVLGLCYHEGQGVETNLKLAEKYYRRAIKEGSDVAMYNLGLLLRDKAEDKGNGQLARESRKWLERAQEKGVDGAQEALENAWDLESSGAEIGADIYTTTAPSAGQMVGKALTAFGNWLVS